MIGLDRGPGSTHRAGCERFFQLRLELFGRFRLRAGADDEVRRVDEDAVRRHQVVLFVVGRR